jgi:hypothetical protein
MAIDIVSQGERKTEILIIFGETYIAANARGNLNQVAPFTKQRFGGDVIGASCCSAAVSAFAISLLLASHAHQKD